MQAGTGGRGVGKRRGRPARSADGSRADRRTVAERLEAGELTLEDATEKARETLLRMLAAAPKSRRELEQSLARKGYPEQVVTPLLDRFGDVGLVDDTGYAELIVRTRHAERGLARRAIAMELRRRGIDEETASQALEHVDPEGEREAAAELARKHVRRTRGLDPQVRIRRAVGAIARKGHSPGIALEVVREALAAEGEDVADDVVAYDLN
jgi:regulatory protein